MNFVKFAKPLLQVLTIGEPGHTTIKSFVDAASDIANHFRQSLTQARYATSASISEPGI